MVHSELTDTEILEVNGEYTCSNNGIIVPIAQSVLQIGHIHISGLSPVNMFFGHGEFSDILKEIVHFSNMDLSAH